MAAIALTAAGIPAALAWAATRPVTEAVWSQLGDGSRVLQAFGRPIDDGEVVVAVVLLGAVTWAWIMLCLVVEVAARLRGVAPPTLPASASLQRVIGVAVGLALTVAMPAARAGALPPNGAGHPASVAAAGAPTAATALTADPAGERPPSPPGAVRTTAAGSVAGVAATTGGHPPWATTSATYTVRPGDTLWGIARAELGDPLRWRDLAAANLGRPQADGQCLRDDNWILPGWILVLPEEGTAAASPSNGAQPGDGPTVASATSATSAAAGSWGPSGASSPATGSAPAPEPSAATGSALATGPSPAAEPSRVAAPAAAVPRAAVPSAAMAAGSEQALPAPERQPPSPVDAVRSAPGNGRPRPGDPLVTFAEFGLLAGAVVAALDRMRRVQQRHRRTGLRIALPTDDVAALELDLRRRARRSRRPALDAVYRAVGDARRSVGTLAVTWVAVGDDVAELGIGGGMGAIAPAAPPPFVADQAPDRWRLPIAEGCTDVVAAATRAEWRGPWASVPATVVTAGRTDGELVVVDLAVMGALAVEAPAAEAVCRGMVVELATNPDADDVELLVVGADRSLAALERVRTADDVDQVLQLMMPGQGTATAGSGALPPDPAHLPVTVVVVVHHEPGTEASIEALAGLAVTSGGTLAMVAAGPVRAAPWRLQRDAQGTATLHESQAPGGSRAVAGRMQGQLLDAVTAGTIAALIDTASPSPGVDPDTPPYDRIPGSGGATLARARGARPERHGAPADGEVEVRVLGPVAVVGAERPFTRAWTLDLVVFLALHPAGATTEQWSTALWPDRLMAPATLHSTASAARRALGRDGDGEDHLPRSHGRLRLGPGVRTDWDLLQQWGKADDPDGWCRALALVRGRPLDGLRAIDWALLDGLLPAIEATVVDLAERRGLWCLDEGDAAGATWAARRGLLVCPYDERLYRVLLRAADMAGNPAAVEAAMAELVRLVAEDVEPYDAVHPETLELYRALSRRAVRASS